MLEYEISLAWLERISFTGYYKRKADPKGRITVPFPIQQIDALKDQELIFFAKPLRNGEYRCIRIMLIPKGKKDELVEYYNSKPEDDLERRAFFSSTEGSVDAQHRINLGELLNYHLGGARKLGILGVGKVFEVYTRRDGEKVYRELMGINI